MASADTVLIVDGGGAGARHVARRVRHLNVYCEVVPLARRIREKKPRGVIVVGAGEPPAPEILEGAGAPVLTISSAAATAVTDEELRRFLFDDCGCSGSWTMESFIEQAVADIRSQVGTGRVVAGLSGGVDSAGAAALLHRGVGAQRPGQGQTLALPLVISSSAFSSTTDFCAKVKRSKL